MQGLKIKCPNCTRISFETTDQFNPDVPPHGGMVKSLLQYHIDWLCTSTTKASEMTCPECLAPLVVGGVLNVIMPAREAGECFIEKLGNRNGHFIPTADLIGGFREGSNAEEGTVLAHKIFNPPIHQTDGEVFEDDKPWEIPVDSGAGVNEAIGESPAAKCAPDVKTKIAIDKFICDVCGKPCKSELGLNSHKRSHKEK